MTGIPPHKEPQTLGEWEIAKAMTVAGHFYDYMKQHYPEIPDTAISVGLINYGAQIGCRHTNPSDVAEYLKGVANIIAPVH